MKRLLLILCLILLPSLVWAGDGCLRMAWLATIMSGPVAAAGGVPGTVGNTTTGDTDQNVSQDFSYAYRAQADQNGNLTAAYVYHNDLNDGGNCKVCIYNSTDAHIFNEGVNATLVGCSNAIASGITVGWKTAVFAGAFAVVSGNWYWVVLTTPAVNPNIWINRRDGAGAGDQFWRSGTLYAAPPNPCPVDNWDHGAWGVYSFYATIN